MNMALWVWLLIIAAGVAIVVVAVRSGQRRVAHRLQLAENERLAQVAEARHEAPRTRHEGGA